MMNEVGELMRVSAVAGRLDCSVRWIYTLIEEGKLEIIRLGKRGIRVKRDSLDLYLAAARVDHQERLA